MLDVRQWYAVVQQMADCITRRRAEYFVVDMTTDEVAATRDVLAERFGYCPEIRTCRQRVETATIVS